MSISLKNLGTVNKNMIKVGQVTIWFSYETPVAYQIEGSRIVCRVNDWSPITGKFLNELEPNKEERLDGEQFEKQLDNLTHNIITKI